MTPSLPLRRIASGTPAHALSPLHSYPRHARARRARGGGRRARRNARAKVALGRDARQRLWRRPERDAAARARQHRRHAGGTDRRADAGGGRDGPRPSRLRLAQQRRRADARADPGEPVGARDGGAEPAADGRRPRRALPSERVQGAQAARLVRAHPHAGAQAPRHADPCRGRDAALPDPVGAARRGAGPTARPQLSGSRVASFF